MEGRSWDVATVMERLCWDCEGASGVWSREDGGVRRDGASCCCGLYVDLLPWLYPCHCYSIIAMMTLKSREGHHLGNAGINIYKGAMCQGQHLSFRLA